MRERGGDSLSKAKANIACLILEVMAGYITVLNVYHSSMQAVMTVAKGGGKKRQKASGWRGTFLLMLSCKILSRQLFG